MRVGWLCDDPGYLGGAELTQQEFRAAAPEGVEVIECPPGAVVPDLDAYFIGNCVHYTLDDIGPLKNTFKYLNDQWPHTLDGVRDRVLAKSHLIFCSPLHRDRFPHEVPHDNVSLIPPPVDVDRFKPNRQAKRNTEREGTCAIAGWRNTGKGAALIERWAQENGPVDIYGGGDFYPGGPGTNYCGEVTPDQMPQTLWAYERLVFLPIDLEPFCRCVVEAHYAGCEVITNGLIGSRYWLEEKPEAIGTAAADLWALVTG